MNLKTFFLSEDINLILNGNSLYKDFYKGKGLVVPQKEKINTLRAKMLENLKNTYGNVEVIPEEDLLFAMQSLAKSSNYPLVSLDEIYLNGNENVQEFLNLSRIKVGNRTFISTRSSEGLYLPYEKEICRVCDKLEQRYAQDCPHRNFAY
ncbi:MAG: hypothetical protein IJB10_04985 [Clostridia bacterium]|nr:hypothetical protein [Clostridia bacterium]